MGAPQQITGRDRVLAALTHRTLDRVPITETCYWPETIERWRAEGLPKDADPMDLFGLEFAVLGYDHSLLRPREVIEETERFVIARESDGTIRREWKGRTATPEFLEYPLKSEADWSQMRGEVLAEPERRVQGLKDAWPRHREAGRFMAFGASEPGWYCVRLMGFEAFGLAVLEKPDLLRQIMQAMVRQFADAFDCATKQGMEPDGVMIYGDLCFRNGPLVSPKHFRELILPYQRDMVRHARKPVIWHCDGDVRLLMPFVAEAGISCMQPLEARAGNDVRTMKRQYGEGLAFMGNIAVEAMSAGGEQMEEEIASKIGIAKEGGGYIFHSDHSVPPTVSLENYTKVLELVKRYGAY